MTKCTASLFYDANTSLYLWNVFVRACQVHSGTCRNILNYIFERSEFTIRVYGLDTEALWWIESKNILKGIKYNCCCTFFQVNQSCEVNFSAQGYEEHYPIDKENVSGQKYCLLEISNIFGNFYTIQRYHSRLASDSLYLQGTGVLSPYLFSSINIPSRHFTIFDLVVFYQPLEICVQLIQQFSVQIPC